MAAILTPMLRVTAVMILTVAVATTVWDLVSGAPTSLVVALPLNAVLAAATATLFASMATTRLQLRIVEATLFATITLYFALRSHALITADLAAAEAAWGTSVLHLMLIVGSYAMFVPNSPRRAALVIAALAPAPVVVALCARADQPLLTESFTAETIVVGMVPLVIGGLIAIAGAGLIAMFRNIAITEKEMSMYDLHERIGRGGMGEVWRAEHHRLAREVAIKLVRADKLAESSPAKAKRLLDRFEHEARVTASLRSVNTVEVFDFGVTDNGIFYYVMEYLEGIDLDALVREFGPLPPARAIYLLRQICASLAEAHATGLIHRDIKPANLQLTRLGVAHDVVKVLDFGLAEPTNDSDVFEVMGSDEGTVRGTPAFMPPEVATDGVIDARSDIYAVGCAAYWLLTGTLVFKARSAMKMAVAHATREPSPPSSRGDNPIPPELDAIVMRCLAKDPDARFADALALEQALADCPVARWDERQAQRWWQEYNALPAGKDPAPGEIDSEAAADRKLPAPTAIAAGAG